MSTNRVRYYFVVLTLYALGFSVVGCFEIGATSHACPGKEDELRGLAARELSIGAGDDLVRDFLARHQVRFSFDGYSSRYQGIVREVKNAPGVDCAVVVYVYVDADKRYLRSEFFASYTGL